MNTLYELATNYMQALDYLTDPENEIDKETALDTIESLDGTLDDKMLNVGRFITSMEAQASAIEAIEKRQKARRQALSNKAAWLRDYLNSAMKETGKEKVSANDIVIKLAKLPISVQVDDLTAVPEEFWRIERSIDKVLIKAAGGCAGVRIESAGFRVSIK
jgi:hypothetical protein